MFLSLIQDQIAEIQPLWGIKNDFHFCQKWLAPFFHQAFQFICFYKWKLTLMKLFSLFTFPFAPFYCFFVRFSHFWQYLTFWENFEIRDGGSKMAAVWTSWGNCQVIWHHHTTWQKVDFHTYYIPSTFHCHCLNILEVTEVWHQTAA